jgi:hypothetical protein
MKKKSDEEIFDINQKRFWIKKKDFKENLRKFYSIRNKKAFTRDDYDSWGNKVCSSDTIFRHYGSWEKALEDVGITAVKKDQYTVEELLGHYEKVWRWVEQPPSLGDLKKYNLKFSTSVSGDSYTRRWGSYKSFQKIFSEYMLGKLNLNEVKSKIKDKNIRRKAISLFLRSQVLKKNNFKCQHCGKGVEDNIKLEIDHIVPKSKGGLDNLENYQVLCNECNKGKSNKFTE